MIYVVSGFPRSGTSAMMQALQAGGIDVVSNDNRSKSVHWHDDNGYHMNPGDVYESTAKERECSSWPRQHDGKAIKVVAMWLGQLAVHAYRVVFMTRDAEEIRQSYEAAFSGKLTLDHIKDAIDEGLRTLHNRADVEQVTTIRYDDLLNTPCVELERLGWDINLHAAASVVDSSLKRFDLPLLTVGA